MMTWELMELADFTRREAADNDIQMRVMLDKAGLLIVARKTVRDERLSANKLVLWDMTTNGRNGLDVTKNEVRLVAAALKGKIDKALHK